MFVRDHLGNLIFMPRNQCFVEGEGAAAGAGGAGEAAGAAAAGAGEGKAAEGAAAAAKEGEGAAAAAAVAKAAEGAAPSWRDDLKNDDAKKFAERSPDLDHLVMRAKDANDRLSKAIIPPGKDAKPEEVEAYRKQIGVPTTADGYKFVMPEGVEASDGDKAMHGKLAETFHALNISKDQAKTLNKVWNEMTVAGLEAQVEEDKRFAEQAEAQLRQEWRGDEFDKNMAHADRAAVLMFGDQLDEVRVMETKDGRFILDHPVMLKALAVIGREAAEGGPVPPMSATAAEQAQDEVKSLREKAQEASARGDSKEANRLYQKEQDLIKKMQGNRPIVGSQGRAA